MKNSECTPRPGTVSYVCVCGTSGRLGMGGPDEILAYMKTIRGWRYVRQATGENKANGWDYEGLCPECQELDD